MADPIPRDAQGNVDMAALQAQQAAQQRTVQLEFAGVLAGAAVIGGVVGSLIGGKDHRVLGGGTGAALGLAVIYFGRFYLVGAGPK